MKKLLTFMLMMIGMVLMSTLTTSCRNHQKESEPDPDSVWVANIVSDINHAEYTDVNEFMVYLVDKRDQQRADSITFRLHDSVIVGICNVILSHHGKLSTRSICDEYLAHKTFYDGMNNSLSTHDIPPIESTYRPATDTTIINEFKKSGGTE